MIVSDMKSVALKTGKPIVVTPNFHLKIIIKLNSFQKTNYSLKVVVG